MDSFTVRDAVSFMLTTLSTRQQNISNSQLINCVRVIIKTVVANPMSSRNENSLSPLSPVSGPRAHLNTDDLTNWMHINQPGRERLVGLNHVKTAPTLHRNKAARETHCLSWWELFSHSHKIVDACKIPSGLSGMKNPDNTTILTSDHSGDHN